MDLRHRPDRRPRVRRRRRPGHGDRRREPPGRGVIGPPALVDERPDIGGEAFDVSLPGSGEERVENERRFPAARRPAHGRELAEGDADVDPPEVVGCDALEDDGPVGRGTAGVGRPARRRSREFPPQGPSRQRLAAGRDRLGAAAGDDTPAVIAAPRPEVDDVIGRPDDVGMMLDGDDGPAEIDQALEGREQVVDVGPVEARRRLLQDVEDRSAGRPAHLGGELDALGLAARQGRRALAELEVAEAEPPQDLEVGGQALFGRVERGRLVDAHLEDVVDRLAAVAHGQRFVVEAAAFAIGTDDVDVAQEMHADLQQPGALAGLAPAAGDIEREPALAEAPCPGPRAGRRRDRGRGRRSSCRSRDWSGASGRWGTGRSRRPGPRSPRSPRRRRPVPGRTGRP